MTDRKFCATQIRRCASQVGFDHNVEFPEAMADLVGALATSAVSTVHAEATITRWLESSRYAPTVRDIRTMAHATMRPEWTPTPVPVCSQCFDGWRVKAEGGAEPCTCPRGLLRKSRCQK